MITHPYLEQARLWPVSGRHILAQFDEVSVCVYQAYRPSIAAFATENQRFGGDFSYSRMSWIKPNFLWMMYRSGWASKEGQEHILAVRIRRAFFDEMLRLAVPSTHDPARYSSQEQWKTAVANSDVRLQWDPDHDPFGRPLDRRAVQLGLRGEVLRRYGEKEILSIEDITAFVASQRANLTGGLEALVTPKESVYVPASEESARAVGIDPPPGAGASPLADVRECMENVLAKLLEKSPGLLSRFQVLKSDVASPERWNTGPEFVTKQIGCLCGSQEVKVATIQRAEKASIFKKKPVITCLPPVYISCPKCSRTELLFDPDMHGWDGQEESEGHQPNQGDAVAFSESAGSVLVNYSSGHRELRGPVRGWRAESGGLLRHIYDLFP